jgi:ferric-dicitrate binding protein FerR (iron transport regulator)
MIDRAAANALSRRQILGGAALLGAGAAGAAFFSHRSEAAGPIGLVERLQGAAKARRADADLSLAPQAEIFVNDTISTAQEARLILALGQTTIRLGSAARIRIDKFLARRGGVIDLEAGPMLFDRPEDAPKTDIEFRSAYAVVAVRGTRFFAGPSKGVFGVFVERGALDVSAVGKVVRLTAGLGTNIANPGEPPTDAAEWKLPRISAAMASVE